MVHMINHILAKEGILTTFSIAKRISIKDVQDLRKKMKGKKSSSEKFKNLLKDKIVEETNKALIGQKIPGVIVPNSCVPENERKQMMELTYFASIIAKKINEKKIDKYHSCYIINAMVNMLSLSEKDFDDFHQKFSKFRNDDKDEGENV